MSYRYRGAEQIVPWPISLNLSASLLLNVADHLDAASLYCFAFSCSAFAKILAPLKVKFSPALFSSAIGSCGYLRMYRWAVKADLPFYSPSESLLCAAAAAKFEFLKSLINEMGFVNFRLMIYKMNRSYYWTRRRSLHYVAPDARGRKFTRHHADPKAIWRPYQLPWADKSSFCYYAGKSGDIMTLDLLDETFPEEQSFFLLGVAKSNSPSLLRHVLRKFSISPFYIDEVLQGKRSRLAKKTYNRFWKEFTWLAKAADHSEPLLFHELLDMLDEVKASASSPQLPADKIASSIHEILRATLPGLFRRGHVVLLKEIESRFGFSIDLTIDLDHLFQVENLQTFQFLEAKFPNIFQSLHTQSILPSVVRKPVHRDVLIYISKRYPSSKAFESVFLTLLHQFPLFYSMDILDVMWDHQISKRGLPKDSFQSFSECCHTISHYYRPPSDSSLLDISKWLVERKAHIDLEDALRVAGSFLQYDQLMEYLELLADYGFPKATGFYEIVLLVVYFTKVPPSQYLDYLFAKGYPLHADLYGKTYTRYCTGGQSRNLFDKEMVTIWEWFWSKGIKFTKQNCDIYINSFFPHMEKWRDSHMSTL